MLLSQLRLHNIRSFLDQSITFPEGSILLAGEIGAGKSTILLAVEFALFGITRGVLSGNSLLRAGSAEGWVELDFEVDGKRVQIKRTLKRFNDDVRQHTGHLSVDGKTVEATPVELKSAVLALLGYPPQLLTKSKSLIYRYTVYTPQEEMKKILLDESEYRVDTLRRIFQIERYRVIRENLPTVSRDIKQKIDMLSGRTQDLPEKKSQLVLLADQETSASAELAVIAKRYEEALALIKTRQELLSSKETELRALDQLVSRIKVVSAQQQEKVRQIQMLTRELEVLRTQIESQTPEARPPPDPGLSEEAIEKEQRDEETKRFSMIRSQAEHQQEIRAHEQTKSEALKTNLDIASLTVCPTCKQPIPKEHAKHFHEEHQRKIADAEAAILAARAALSGLDAKLASQESAIDSIRQKHKALNDYKLKLAQWENAQRASADKKEQCARKETTIANLKRELGMLNKELSDREAEKSAFTGVEERFKALREELEHARADEGRAAVEESRQRAGHASVRKAIQLLQDEIHSKERAKASMEALQQRQTWLTELLAPMLLTMERQVMMRVYKEFDQIFQEFFGILIDEETLSVRLDQEFSPVIEQNGYEIAFEDLSGGEKTSLALAYRLALTKVINDVIETIKTKDIIILDEPTDGFSDEQLDKMRAVLERIDTMQTILVSHESKIESFVEHVIRIQKQEHTSIIK